jgi:hypothetical protein
MRKTEKTVSWVVYRMTMRVKGQTTGMGAVCEQGEWEAMERTQPGHHMLIRAGITNEGEAERLARTIETVSIEQPSTRPDPARSAVVASARTLPAEPS